jgi:serine phosphatase RsbU (regulator of sigma subunit)
MAQPLTIVAAARPHSDETVSGDRWSVDWCGSSCRIAVIDGLGHGPLAAEAAAIAAQTLAARPELPPDEALRVCHQALKGTRGAAISLARIDPDAVRLTYAGVGNVEARLWQSGCQQRPIAFRGIVGAALPTCRSFDFDLEPGWLLLLHTDGISARFQLEDFQPTILGEPRALADAILARWGREHDDATVVVARAGSALRESH